MFPHDFDGIIAGSPALDFNNLASWRASFFPITGSVNSTDFITASTWTNVIHNEILNQCDGLDGVIDGIIEDPDLCNFTPDALVCNYNKAADCLTPVQVEMVRKIFSPLYGEDGKLIYPAMQPGSEGMAVNKLYAGKPFSYSEVLEMSLSFQFYASTDDIRTGSDTLSTVTAHGILPLSQSAMPPQPRQSIRQISGPGRMTFLHSAIPPARSSAITAAKTIKSQAITPKDSINTFQAACKLRQGIWTSSFVSSASRACFIVIRDRGHG